MNARLLLVLLVIGASIESNEANWFHKAFNKVKHAVHTVAAKVAPIGKKILPVAKSVGKFVAAHPQVMTAALALKDEEFMDDLKALQATDQASYDQAIESLRSDLASSMADEDADDIITDLESFMHMVDDEDRITQ